MVVLILMSAVSGALLQATILRQFTIAGNVGDVVLVLVIAYAIFAALPDSLLVAFAGGLAQDLLSVSVIGTHALGLLLIAYAVHYLSRQISHVNLLFMVTATLIASIFQLTFVLVLLNLTVQSIGLIDAIRYFYVPVTLYNLVISIPMYVVIRRLHKGRQSGEGSLSN
jgi:rod shape-determining protein MreD